MTSSVSVTSSPSFDNLLELRHGQADGAGIATRSRGRCAGNGFRDGRLRSKDLIGPDRAGRSAASSSSPAAASASSNGNSSWSMRRCLRSERKPWSARFSFSISSFR